MKAKQKYWSYGVLVLAIIGIVFVSGCVEEREAIPEKVPEEEVPTETGLVADCEKIANIDMKDGCYSGIAIETKDAGLCEKIINNALKNTCYATVTRDVNICEKITEPYHLIEYLRGNCYEGVAIETKDSGLCEKIGEKAIKDVCFLKVALEAKDVSVCEKITDQIRFQASKDMCFSKIAIETKDISLCEKMGDDLKKSICYALVTNNANRCDRDDRCYFRVAIETKDSNLCIKITNSNIQDQCYMNIARDTKDSSLCKKISGSSWKEDCYLYTPCKSIAACARKFILGLKRALEA